MDPVSMMMVAAGTKAVGSIIGGEAANNASKADARALIQNRDIARAQAGAREDQSRRQSASLLGEQYARTAQSGIDPNSGSALRVLQDDATKAELDALTIRYEGETQARAYENEARMTRARGKQARAAGYFNAATSVLGGASQAYGMKAAPGSKDPFGIGGW